MNKSLTVSLEEIGQCVLHPDILFPLQPSPHILHSSCPLDATASTGDPVCYSLAPIWSHQLLLSLLPNAPMLTTSLHVWRYPYSSWLCTHGSSVIITTTCLKLLPMLLKTQSTPEPCARHLLQGWVSAVLPGPWEVILFCPHLQLALSITPEMNEFWFHLLSFPFSRVRQVP